ncbi:MAG: hypothetical protein BroJett026_06730 [Betaproteobacteria bacterium]|nr:MAG: hypothetical protein BroJett026_06730 [Betaproteobacteria bacterium]
MVPHVAGAGTSAPHRILRPPVRAAALAVALVLAGCAVEPPRPPPIPASEGRAFVARLLPAHVRDRPGWATDVYAAIAALDLPATAENVCAILAVTEQESSYRADPPVPGLPAIAWKEIERQRERAGIPRAVLDAALALESPDGRSYKARLDAVRTERALSAIFEDFIGIVPLAKPFLASRNPVRTGGPMQVSIAFAEAHARARPYPYPIERDVRHEVFTRRGGLYFGTAHLLDYAAPYDRHLHRFADFNAGRYASRNAAFQRAVTGLTGIPLALDGDLLRYDGERAVRESGHTESAVRVLGGRIDMNAAEIRRDLERAREADFERTRLYARVFDLADRAAGKRVPRAVVPDIPLRSPKFTRPLTTAWFAQRVQTRFAACLGRAGA